MTKLRIRKLAIFFAAAVLSICAVLSGCCTHQEQQKENVSLLIPEKIYAVPGVETNVYFNNVVTALDDGGSDAS